MERTDDNAALTKQEKEAISRYEFDQDKHQYDASKILQVEKMTPEEQKAFADKLLDQEAHRKVESAAGPSDRPSPGQLLNRGQGDTPAQTTKPADATPGTTEKTGDGKGGVDAKFDDWIKQQTKDKDHPQSAYDLVKQVKELHGQKPTPQQVDEIYKLTGEEKFRKIDEFVDKHKQNETLDEQIADLAKNNPSLLTRENIDRLYRDNQQPLPEVANDGKSVTSVEVPGIKGRVNVTKEELQEFEKMQELRKQYDSAMRSGNATEAQALNTQLSDATRKFFADAGQHNNPQIGGPSPEYYHEEQRRLQQLDQERRQLETQMAHPEREMKPDLPKDRAEAIKHGEQGVGVDGNPTPQFCRELQELQKTNPALYQAELEGVTQKLMEMGVIPRESYRNKDSKENVAQVQGISAEDHPGFVIAIGETNHPGQSDQVYIYKDNKYWLGHYKDPTDRNKGWIQEPGDPDPLMDRRRFERIVDQASYRPKQVPRTDATGAPLPPEQQ